MSGAIQLNMSNTKERALCGAGSSCVSRKIRGRIIDWKRNVCGRAGIMEDISTILQTGKSAKVQKYADICTDWMQSA